MTAAGLITIRELLSDPHYKAYFTKVPKLPEHYTPETEPWRLLVLMKGEPKWRGKRFGTYTDAFEGFKRLLPKIDNAAINCPGLNFMPPIRKGKVKGKTDPNGNPIIRAVVWKPLLTPDMSAHQWCGYCRRPSIFSEKAMPARMLNGFRLHPTRVTLRCSICGAPAELMDLRSPQNNQQWDLGRTRLR